MARYWPSSTPENAATPVASGVPGIRPTADEQHPSQPYRLVRQRIGDRGISTSAVVAADAMRPMAIRPSAITTAKKRTNHLAVGCAGSAPLYTLAREQLHGTRVSIDPQPPAVREPA